MASKASSDPVRVAYNKCSRALEQLSSDEERRRVIGALDSLFKIVEPKSQGGA